MVHYGYISKKMELHLQMSWKVSDASFWPGLMGTLEALAATNTFQKNVRATAQSKLDPW